MSIGYYQGKWEELSKLTVAACDRSVYFGDGIYDAAYTYRGKIFALQEHIERFFDGCHSVGIRLSVCKKELTDLLTEGIGKVDTDSFVYWQASCGAGIRNHADRDKEGRLLIMIYPKEIAKADKTLHLMTVEDQRHNMCNIKTLNLMANVLAAQRAEENGCEEAVLLRDGEVAECAHSNIQILKKGVLVSPPPSYCTLDGIGRRHLVAAALRSGIAVSERRFGYSELLSADEIIVTSSGYPCQRAVSVDGKEVGGKDEKNFLSLSRAIYGEIEKER